MSSPGKYSVAYVKDDISGRSWNYGKFGKGLTTRIQ